MGLFIGTYKIYIPTDMNMNVAFSNKLDKIKTTQACGSDTFFCKIMCAQNASCDYCFEYICDENYNKFMLACVNYDDLRLLDLFYYDDECHTKFCVGLLIELPTLTSIKLN